MIDETPLADPEDRVRIDPQSKALIAEYRQRFSSAPVGMWVDCLDNFIGIGFCGVSGHFSETTVKEDGTGRWACRDETILFIWRRMGERVIEVQAVENIPRLEGWTDAELAEYRQWQHVEYDFVVPAYMRVPTICDVAPHNVSKLLDGTIKPYAELQFMECFGYRMGGTLQLRTNQGEVDWQESQWERWLAENRSNATGEAKTGDR